MKSIVSRFLVISILSISFLNASLLTSFASSTSDVKEIASNSNAFKHDYFGDDFHFFADNLPKVESTITFQGMALKVDYYNTNENQTSIYVPISADGTFSIPEIKDFLSFNRFEMYIPKSHLPIDGPYKFQFRFGFSAGRFEIGRTYLASFYQPDNASRVFSTSDIDVQTMSTDVYGTCFFNLQRSSFSQISLSLLPTSSTVKYNPSPNSGRIYVSFSPATIVQGEPTIDVGARPPLSSDDVQSNISDSVGNISSGVTDINNSINSGVSSINGNLEEIIRTISMQLEAFWNQLYNLVHLDDNKNRDENTKKITDKLDQTNKNLDVIDTDILDGFDSLEKNNDSNSNSIINNNNQNTSSIINNNNENTDKLANGYDNSSMIENNDKLAGKLDEYEKLENELLSDTKDNLNNFQFENPFLSFNAVMSDISYILTSIYNGLGSFNIPIAFSMTLTIAMLCIGWYRFKAGG